MSTDEMETVAGGRKHWCIMGSLEEGECPEQWSNYTQNIRKPDGSMNCAATVEDGSWCKKNDACYTDQVNYYGMDDCAKAWQ